MQNQNKFEIDQLRQVMGTSPTRDTEEAKRGSFIFGVDGITVDLVDHSKNPYKAMYILATTCWGDKVNKWARTAPQYRFLVVKAVLEGKTLPLALEAPSFTFVVEGPSRAAFDQLARTRVGAVFSARGMRDNNWVACDIRIPNAIRRLPNQYVQGTLESLTKTMDAYSNIVSVGKGSWQAARTVLPLYVCYGWSATYNYASLRGMCANRMKFCEMEDTVAVAWLSALEVSKAFPLLGSYLRPGCDNTGRCQYHTINYLSEVFGCLFKECGRNTCESDTGYAEFNETCTNYHDLEVQLGIKITKPEEWPNYTWETLPESDRQLFMED